MRGTRALIAVILQRQKLYTMGVLLSSAFAVLATKWRKDANTAKKQFNAVVDDSAELEELYDRYQRELENYQNIENNLNRFGEKMNKGIPGVEFVDSELILPDDDEAIVLITASRNNPVTRDKFAALPLYPHIKTTIRNTTDLSYSIWELLANNIKISWKSPSPFITQPDELHEVVFKFGLLHGDYKQIKQRIYTDELLHADYLTKFQKWVLEHLAYEFTEKEDIVPVWYKSIIGAHEARTINIYIPFSNTDKPDSANILLADFYGKGYNELKVAKKYSPKVSFELMYSFAALSDNDPTFYKWQTGSGTVQINNAKLV